MLHTKFSGNLFTGSGEEDFEGVSTIHVHVTQLPRTNFRSPYQRRLLIIFGFDWPSDLEKKRKRFLSIVDDGRRRKSDAIHLVYCKLNYEPSVQVSL